METTIEDDPNEILCVTILEDIKAWAELTRSEIERHKLEGDIVGLSRMITALQLEMNELDS